MNDAAARTNLPLPERLTTLIFPSSGLRSSDAKLTQGAAIRRLILILATLPYVITATSPWLDVPHVQQTRNGCGAAAVAMVITYWARQFPDLRPAAQETERINDLLPASTKGIKGRDLKQFLQARGFAAYIFTGELDDLRNHVAKGRPVIVCLAPKGSGSPLHYAVVVGIDQESVWLNDSARGKLIRDDLSRFQSAWKVTDNWALLALPADTK